MYISLVLWGSGILSRFEHNQERAIADCSPYRAIRIMTPFRKGEGNLSFSVKRKSWNVKIIIIKKVFNKFK